MKKFYKPKFKTVEVVEHVSAINSIIYAIRLGDKNPMEVLMHKQTFNELFEPISGCNECACNVCTNSCKDIRCNECDVYNLKVDKCEYRCETCVFRSVEMSPMCKACVNYSNWKESNWMVKDLEPIELKYRFTDETKGNVFRSLAEIQFNIYPSFEGTSPVIVIPDKTTGITKFVVELGDTVVVKNREITDVIKGGNVNGSV